MFKLCYYVAINFSCYCAAVMLLCKVYYAIIMLLLILKVYYAAIMRLLLFAGLIYAVLLLAIASNRYTNHRFRATLLL